MRIGRRMAAVADFVSAHPGCQGIDAARHVAPERYGRVGLGYGYQTVHRAARAGLIRVERSGSRGGRFKLFPINTVD